MDIQAIAHSSPYNTCKIKNEIDPKINTQNQDILIYNFKYFMLR